MENREKLEILLKKEAISIEKMYNIVKKLKEYQCDNGISVEDFIKWTGEIQQEKEEYDKIIEADNALFIGLRN